MLERGTLNVLVDRMLSNGVGHLATAVSQRAVQQGWR